MRRRDPPPLAELAARWGGRFTTSAEWAADAAHLAGVAAIGDSACGRPLLAAVIGTGSLHATLLGGVHADEPVGPETLRLLVAAAARGEAALAPLLRRWRLWVVPHVNPDGEHANRGWIERWPSVGSYLRQVVREPPGRDLEFGFPAMQPENAAVAAFGARAAPVLLHASLHGMAFATGAQLLIERSWATRTAALRRAFGREATACGLGLHDEDRAGEKGFHYLERGFATTPTSAAMRAHFRAAGDERTAELFGDSSMEQAARTALGAAAPLCIVTEVPLFRLPGGSEAYRELRSRLAALVLQAQRGVPIAADLARVGIEPVDPRAAIRLQLCALELGFAATEAALSASVRTELVRYRAADREGRRRAPRRTRSARAR